MSNESFEQVDLFSLMSDDEAQAFKPEPEKAVKPTLNKVKGTKGATLEEWKEAMDKDDCCGEDSSCGSDTCGAPVTTKNAPGKKGKKKALTSTSTVPKTEPKPEKKIEDDPAYNKCKKLFCYAGHYHEIDDPALSLEDIRKMFEKIYPELSKERTEMVYQKPVNPEAAIAELKEEKKPMIEDLSIEELEERLALLGEVERAVAEGGEIDTTSWPEDVFLSPARIREFLATKAPEGVSAINEMLASVRKELEEVKAGINPIIGKAGSEATKDLREKLKALEMETLIKVWDANNVPHDGENRLPEYPIVVNGEEVRGLIIPVLKGAHKGSDVRG